MLGDCVMGVLAKGGLDRQIQVEGKTDDAHAPEKDQQSIKQSGNNPPVLSTSCR